MQGIEKITDKIISDAKAKAEEIITAAYTQAAATVKESADAAISERTQKRAEGEIEQKRAEERVVSAAVMNARKAILEAKQNIVEKTFNSALVNLLNLPDKEYEAVLINLIAEVSETGNEVVLLSAKDKKRVSDDFVSEINQRLKKLNKQAEITLSEESVDICGGFVLKRGSIELNNAFDSLMKQGRQDLDLQVAEILFK